MTSTSPTHDDAAGLVRVGDVIAGKYRVERVIGVGGMGVVVAATHLQLEEKVAIKLLLPTATQSRTLAERFVREARAAVKIKSEHVARVVDVGTLDSGTPYMIMEYLSGSDLADTVRTAGPVSVQLAVEYVLQACEALAEAHSAGIVHRDLKPANLFLTRRADGSPCVKVLDFGISKVVTGGGDPRITDTTAVMGSPFYMSPEQLKSSRDVDARTDIWSLGVILFELLSGVPPFDGETMPQLCVAIMTHTPRDILSYRKDLPPGLEAVIRRCLEKTPEGRYHHVGELAEALAPFASGRARISIERATEISRTMGRASRPEASSSPAIAATVLSTAPAVQTSPTWSGTLTPAQRQTRLMLVVLGSLLSLVAGALIAFFAFRPPAKHAAAGAQTPTQAESSTVAATSPYAAPSIAPAGPSASSSTGPAPVPSASARPPSASTRPPSASTRPPAPSVKTPTPNRPAPSVPPARPTPAPPAPGPGTLFDDRK